MLGAEVELQKGWDPVRREWVPAFCQRLVANKVADVLEACADEWLNGETEFKGPDRQVHPDGVWWEGGWQEGPLLPEFCEFLCFDDQAPTCISFLQKMIASNSKLLDASD